MVHLHAVHNDVSISYNINTQVPRTEVMSYGFKGGDFQLILSPEKIAIYGETEWRSSMLTAIRNAVTLFLSYTHKCTLIATRSKCHPHILYVSILPI